MADYYGQYPPNQPTNSTSYYNSMSYPSSNQQPQMPSQPNLYCQDFRPNRQHENPYWQERQSYSNPVYTTNCQKDDGNRWYSNSYSPHFNYSPRKRRPLYGNRFSLEPAPQRFKQKRRAFSEQVEEIEAITKDGDSITAFEYFENGIAKQTFYCGLCHIRYVDVDAVRNHLQDRVHLENKFAKTSKQLPSSLNELHNLVEHSKFQVPLRKREITSYSTNDTGTMENLEIKLLANVEKLKIETNGDATFVCNVVSLMMSKLSAYLHKHKAQQINFLVDDEKEKADFENEESEGKQNSDESIEQDSTEVESIATNSKECSEVDEVVEVKSGEEKVQELCEKGDSTEETRFEDARKDDALEASKTNIIEAINKVMHPGVEEEVFNF